MAIIEKTAPNGQVIEFDTTEFSDEEIEQYLNLPKFKKEIPQNNEVPEDTRTRNIVTDIGLSAVDGVRDGVQATIGLVEDLGDTLGEKTGFYGIGFGDGDGKFELSDLKPNILSFKEAQDKGLIDDKLTLPDFDKDPETIAGGFTRGITQFLTGWFTGGRLLKGAKAVTGTGQLAKSVARGSIADFQAFDQDSGRLADMVSEYAPELENPLTDYLESDENDTWYEARFKNALEGAFIGGALEGTFRAFRWYKNKKGEANGTKFDKEQLAKDEEYLKIYHGTNVKFDEFDWRETSDGAIWFTDKKEAIEQNLVGSTGNKIILERLLNKSKIKLMSSEEADKLLDDQVIQKGFDGIKFEADEKLGTYYKIFNPEKLNKVKEEVTNLDLKKTNLENNKVRKSNVTEEFADTYQANLKTLEDGIFNTYKTAQDEFNKNGLYSKDFAELLDDMNISTQFNVRQLNDLNENGLISEIAFAKTIKKLIDDKKIVISDEVIERNARKFYEGKPNVLESDIDKLVQDLKKAPETVVAMNAYRGFLNQASKRLAKVGLKDPVARQLWKQIVLKNLSFVNASKEKISSQIARTQRLQATSFGTDIAREQDNLIREIEEVGLKGNEEEFLRKWSLTGDADMTKVLEYVSRNRTWDVANEIWINALLSNPKTHIINMTSNLFNMFIRPLEKSVGSLTGFLSNTARAKKLRQEGLDALGSYVSMGRYLKDAVKYAGIALKKEDGILTSRNKLDTPRKAIQKKKIVDGKEVEDDSILGTSINMLGKVIRTPSRFLTAEDEFFKQIQYRTHLEKYAFEQAVKDGKSHTKIIAYDIKTKRPITEFQQAVIENFDNGFDKFGRARIREVLKMAEEGTYTNELTGIFKRLGDLTNEYPILKQIIPFTRTPMNLMLNVVDRTPLGFLRKTYRDDFFGRAGTERMAQARGQLATGFLFTMLANKLVAEGHITGSQGQVRGEKTTKSKELKDLRKARGVIPYSFRYYDEEAGTYKYREFGRFDPFGAFFGLVVDFHTYRDQLDEETLQRAGANLMLLLAQQGGGARDYLSGGQKLGNTISAIGSSVSRNLVSKTYLKGLADFMEVFTDDSPDKVMRYAKSKVGSFIPNIYTKFVNDPFYRDTKSIFDEVKKRGNFGEEVEFKYDFRGNALKIQGNETTRLINGVFNPFGETTQQLDPVAEEMFRLGVNLPSMKTTLRGNVELTLFLNDKGQTAYNRQQELLRKVRIGGLSLDQKLQQVINSSGYKELSDPRAVDENVKDIGGKAKLLRRIVKDYHTAVEELLIKESKNFKSTQDDTGKFTLYNSLNAVNINLEKLKMGINVNSSDLQSIYQFSK